MADVEHEPPVDDVGIGRDHPVGRRVGAVWQVGLQPDAHPVLARDGRREVVDLIAPRVVNPYGAQRPADGLVKLEDHIHRLRPHRRPPPARCRATGRAPQRTRPTSAPRCPPAQAPTSSVGVSPGFFAGVFGCPRSRRRRRAGWVTRSPPAPHEQHQPQAEQHDDHQRHDRANRRLGSFLRHPEELPVHRSWLGPHFNQYRQSKIFVRLPLSLTCAGGIGDIQWIRWSCHSNCPVRSTTVHRGGASADAEGGTVTWA